MAIHHPFMARPFLSLSHDFLQDCWRSKATLKPKSPSKRRCWDDWNELAILKRLGMFTGLRLAFLFLDFPEETRRLLGPGVLMEETLRGTYSPRPSSTILEILRPDGDSQSSEDGLMLPTAYHCSCEFLTALRRSTAWFTHAQTQPPPVNKTLSPPGSRVQEKH